jgi:hypothetical protein
MLMLTIAAERKYLGVNLKIVGIHVAELIEFQNVCLTLFSERTRGGVFPLAVASHVYM